MQSLIFLAANPADVSEFWFEARLFLILLSQLTLLLFCAEVEGESDHSVGEERGEGECVGQIAGISGGKHVGQITGISG